MRSSPKHNKPALWLLLVLAFAGFISACNTTKLVPKDQYLLRSNELVLKSDYSLANRGELSDALYSLMIQKPNQYFLWIFPYKVWLYNSRYKKYERDSSAEAFQLRQKTVERPVIYDSALAARSALHIKSYLFNQGFFYSKVSDTFEHIGKRKVKAVYEVEAGLRYLINNTTLDIDDSTIRQIVSESMSESVLQKGRAFAMVLGDDERSRIANILRNRGYYKFSRENIRVEIDTFNQNFLRDIEDPFQSAINYLADQKNPPKPTVDLKIIIREGPETNAYRRFRIGRVRVYPDFVDRKDISDPTMQEHVVDSITFRYHDYFVRERMLLQQIFLRPGEFYTQDNYDQTISKLNELGLFQYVQVYILEDSTLPVEQNLRCVILMNPTKRFDFTANVEATTGTTYTAGSSLIFTFRNRNLGRGANQLAIALNAGVEYGYNEKDDGGVFDKLFLLSRNAGLNSTIQFPKFVAPFNIKAFERNNQPRTLLGMGINVLERVTYFTLINTSASFNYNWIQNKTNTWDFSPAFMNLQKLPRIDSQFQVRLDNNELLRHTYSEIFIEGENLFYTFSNKFNSKSPRHYSYIRVGFEESGALLSGVDALISIDTGKLKYSQYLKLEADLRHYFRRNYGELATRFFAGVGLPYGNSTVLPYIKQYYVGGPYSLRGFRIRQLGPGSYLDTQKHDGPYYIDRTGDIKLEANIELRLNLFTIYGMDVNFAAFADAGNIWLAQPAADLPRGNFTFENLFKDVAISGGAGLRFDISGLFVVRTDAGFPIKRPDYPEGYGGGWIKKQNPDQSTFNFITSTLIGHLAIGYPF